MRRVSSLILLLALLAVGCSQSVKSDKVEIRFWHGLSGPLGDVLNEMIRDFNKTHDDIEVITNPISSYTALQQKLSASLQVGKQPDLAQVFESWAAKYQQDEVLVSIDSLLASDPDFTPEELADFYPVFMQSITYQGEKWSFPFNKSVRAYFYNKDAFYRAGLDPNYFPATWQEFTEHCRRLTSPQTEGRDATWGANFTVNQWQFVNLIHQAGGTIMDENDKPVLNSRAGLEALNYILNLVNVEETAKASKEMDGQNAFLAGTVAMFEGSSVSITYMRQQPINFNVGYAPLPTYKTDKSAISGANIVIFKSGDPAREKAAWEFIKWFTDTEQTAKWSARTCYMPLRKSAMRTQTIIDFLDTFPQFKGIYAQLENAVFEPQHPAWFEGRDELKKYLEIAKEGIMPPQEALDEAAAKLQEIIDREAGSR
ncbi:MAG: ABC transporter substrate-binding protein [Candidatus Cloacimonetes bacterium]|nr:ABC transporter substrate-binding protein [Candidatus Cloacimonadota bacterium]